MGDRSTARAVPATRARPGRFAVLAALLLTGLLTGLLAGCGDDAASTVRGADDGFHGTVVDPPFDVPATALTDTDGQPFSLTADTPKPLTLVFFGYSHCPDICQTVLASIASGLLRLDDEQRAQVDVVFVTTDPDRDDEAALRAYLDRFDPTFIGLTGELDAITEIAGALGVAIEPGKRLPGGGYEVDHSTPVLGITADDKAPLVWTSGTSSAQFAEDIARELDQEAR